MIVNYTSNSVNKLRASLNDDARVVIYNRHMFMVQATYVLRYQLIAVTKTTNLDALLSNFYGHNLLIFIIS
jgi:hypothetical protein